MSVTKALKEVTVSSQRPSGSTKRQLAHLDRLAKAKGRRLPVDLDAEADRNLAYLLQEKYGPTQRAVVCKALAEAADRLRLELAQASERSEER